MRGGEVQVGMDWISVEGNCRESGRRADLKLRWMSDGRCEGENIDGIDCLGPVIRGSALQFEFDSIDDAHSDEDVAGSDPLPVGDNALTTGSQSWDRDRAAGRRGN